MIVNKIIEAYSKYRQTILDSYENPKYLSVVLLISPKAFNELISEETIFRDKFLHYAFICGRRTPIIIKDDLPENVDFVLQSQADYERQEQQELFNRFYKMFGN